MSITIPKWDDYQHYTNRTPPWIKLHRKLLNNPSWFEIPDPSARLLVELWLLASEGDTPGTIDFDLETLAFRLRRASNVLANALLPLHTTGLVSCSGDMLASCKRLASTEERRDREETETEGETKAAADAREQSDNLAEWLGDDYDHALPDLSMYTQRAIYGLVGPNGTRTDIWGSIAAERRPPLTSSAIDSYLASKGGDSWHQGFFLSIIEGAVRSARKPPPDSEAGRWTASKEQEHYRGPTRTSSNGLSRMPALPTCDECGKMLVCGQCPDDECSSKQLEAT